MSETERPFLPMSGELGGDFMSGMADSIRERRAREVPGKEGVKEWPEEEWEDKEKEALSEKLRIILKTIFKKALEKALGPLVDFMIDTAAIVAIPTVVTLSMIAFFQTTFVEVYLATGAATLITIFVSNAKQKLLRHLRFR